MKVVEVEVEVILEVAVTTGTKVMSKNVANPYNHVIVSN